MTMRGLLPEILSEIFIHCLPEEPYPPHSQTAPLLLTRVCKRWRDIALATPRLWASVMFVMHPKAGPSRLAGIKQWFARSGSSALSLHLCYVPSDDDIRSTGALRESDEKLLEVTTGACERWSSVVFTMRVSDVRRFVVVKGRLPLLHTLDLNLSQGIQASSQPLDLFLDAPSLRFVTFSGPLLLGPLVLKLPWNNLTEVQIFHHHYYTAVEILRQTLNLVKCHFSIYEEPGSVRGQLGSLHLEKLESLLCTSTSILTILVAPALRELKLDLPDLENISWTRVYPFLSRSHRKLEKLHITNLQAHTSDQELLQCLQETPDLDQLQLSTSGRCMALSDALLRRMIVRSRDLSPPQLEETTVPDGWPISGYILPKLQEMVLSTYVAFTPNTLVEVITSRWGGSVPQLRKVELWLWGGCGRDGEVEVFEKLDPLKKDGLQFSVRWL